MAVWHMYKRSKVSLQIKLNKHYRTEIEIFITYMLAAAHKLAHQMSTLRSLSDKSV